MTDPPTRGDLIDEGQVSIRGEDSRLWSGEKNARMIPHLSILPALEVPAALRLSPRRHARNVIAWLSHRTIAHLLYVCRVQILESLDLIAHVLTGEIALDFGGEVAKLR